MPNDLPPLTETGVALLATYLLHSTVWLTAAWGLASMCGRRSAALRERLWRAAAILPFLTTLGQFLGSERLHVWTWTLPAVSISSPSDAEPPASQPHRLKIADAQRSSPVSGPNPEGPLAPAAIIVTYDDPQSLAAKAAFVRERGLGGMMYWEHRQDAGDQLLDVLRTGLDDDGTGTTTGH